MKRSYGQYCALAKALDVVGARWTLLIVRELMGGPRRFSDLVDGLPGIGTNLLSDRLSDLQEADVVRKRVLPPPAASTVYELTERGRALIPATVELSRWGLGVMGMPEEGEQFRIHWFMTARTVTFRPERAQGVRLRCEVRTNDGDVAYFRVDDGSLQVLHGPADDPDLALRGDRFELIALLAGWASIDEALSRGVEIEGEIETLERLLEMLGSQPLPQVAAH